MEARENLMSGMEMPQALPPLPEAPLEGEALRKLGLADMTALALAMLREGAMNAASPLRKPALSTISAEGAPTLRTVFLRGFDPAERRLDIFTDARSPKAAEIAAEPRAAMLFYDPVPDIQLRLSGRAAVHRRGAAADAAWSGAALSSRRAYLVTTPPATPSPEPVSGLPLDVEGIIPPLERIEEGRANFALLEFVFAEADILVLSRTGHRRARIRFSADAAQGEWLVP